MELPFEYKDSILIDWKSVFLKLLIDYNCEKLQDEWRRLQQNNRELLQGEREL